MKNNPFCFFLNLYNDTYFPRIIIFLVSFFLFGVFITSADINAFTLQQGGIEALVERGTLYVDGSKTSQFQQLGDTFVYQDHLYAAKQPGQFLIGAIAYKIISLFGISYSTDYLLSSALVTWLTAGLMNALIVLLLFVMVQTVTKNNLTAAIIALLYAFGSIAFPYSGVTHHDIFASFFLFFAFYLLWKFFFLEQKKQYFLVLAGISTGFAISTSLTAVFIAMALCLYALSYRQYRSIVVFGFFVIIGLLPLFAFNYIAFGNPITPPNIAGGFVDTYPVFTIDNVLDKLRFYFYSPMALFCYSPVLVFSFIGIIFLPYTALVHGQEKSIAREKLFFIVQFLFLLAYLCVMTTVGHSQFGTRYLIPSLPFLFVSLVLFWLSYKSTIAHWIQRISRPLILLMGIVSVGFCTMGALHSVMYHFLNEWAVLHYYNKSITEGFPEYPLAWDLSLVLLIIIGLLLVSRFALCHFCNKDTECCRG